MNQLQVIIFGGTFDPPHFGHTAVVDAVLQNFKDARILLVPAMNPPISSDSVKSVTTSHSMRMAMCEAHFSEHISLGKLRVSAIESSLPTPSFTYRTTSAYVSSFPGVKFGFVMGLDQFKAFPKWRNPQGILGDVDLIVVGRGEERLFPNFAAMTESLQIDFETMGDSEFRLKPYGSKVYLLEGALSPLSSSELRNGMEFSDDETSVKVRDLIKKHDLYNN